MTFDPLHMCDILDGGMHLEQKQLDLIIATVTNDVSWAGIYVPRASYLHSMLR